MEVVALSLRSPLFDVAGRLMDDATGHPMFPIHIEKTTSEKIWFRLIHRRYLIAAFVEHEKDLWYQKKKEDSTANLFPPKRIGWSVETLFAVGTKRPIVFLSSSSRFGATLGVVKSNSSRRRRHRRSFLLASALENAKSSSVSSQSR